MFFNTTSRFSSKLKPEQVRNALVGKHVKIKELDFEFKESEGIIKVIPHTENDERSRIVPISHVLVNPKGADTELELKTKPRRIDLGGLYLVVGSIILVIMIAIYLRITYPEQSIWVSISVLVAALIAFLIFRLRLQSSYYGYIGNLRSFIKNQI
jgi:hypothetical protein